MTTERIMDHDFKDGWCIRCGRSRTDLVAYGHPDIKLDAGTEGLSCTGRTNEAEIFSLRDAWRRDRERWDKIFG